MLNEAKYIGDERMPWAVRSTASDGASIGCWTEEAAKALKARLMTFYGSHVVEQRP